MSTEPTPNSPPTPDDELGPNYQVHELLPGMKISMGFPGKSATVLAVDDPPFPPLHLKLVVWAFSGGHPIDPRLKLSVDMLDAFQVVGRRVGGTDPDELKRNIQEAMQYLSPEILLFKAGSDPKPGEEL